MENKEIVFREGDRVFHHNLGWGIIYDIRNEGQFPIKVHFDNRMQESFTLCGKDTQISKISSLSFTEYDFVNGGFSQERPIEIPNRGQICWVRDTHTGKWVISHFLRMFDGKFITSNTIDDINYSTWNYLTTKNPYENEQ